MSKTHRIAKIALINKEIDVVLVALEIADTMADEINKRRLSDIKTKIEKAVKNG